jgi:mannose-6-phosphate isomerase-like protein (cupin superfamily)
LTDLWQHRLRVVSSHPQSATTKAAYVVTRGDHPYEAIAALNHHVTDEGWVHRLSDRQLTGDPTGEFNIGVYRMDPGMTHPLHLHAASAEFYYVLSGKALVTLGDTSVPAGPGTGMYIPCGMPHAISTDEQSDEAVELLYSFSNPDLTAIATRWL